jgi:4-amino-4-deoxy-L-arabinose transferase-like glycosyltransferase
MNQNLKRYIYPAFCFLFLSLNLLQAYFTNLTYDEAYYWLYAEHLAWGYYDHPPLVAIFIKIGYSLLQNELGLRLIGALSNFFILLLLPKILNIEDLKGKLIILLICTTLPLFQLMGFISTPDSPLLFFTCLYFYFLKEFYTKNNLNAAIFLGLTMAMMAYSKYHAFLLVLLTVLSNWQLIKNKLFIVALVIALIAFIPHIYWQIQNEFISFRYHLSDRHQGLELYHFPEYFLNVLLIFNPFMIIFIYKSLGKANIENNFERTLRFIILGTLLFFLTCNFLGHVQPQWLVITMIPTILLLFNYFKRNESNLNNLKKIFWISSSLFLFIRIILIFNVLPINLEFHEYENKVSSIIRKSDGIPVVFHKSYRLASVYAFQTKNINVHCFGYKTAFDQWNQGTAYYNKPVMIVGNDIHDADTINYEMGEIQNVLFTKFNPNKNLN